MTGEASPADPSGSGTSELPRLRRKRYLDYAGLWTLGLAVPALVLGIAGVYNPGMQISNSAPTILGVWALFFPLYVYHLRLPRLPSFALMLAVASVAIALISVGTGWGNGLTDEPYVMPYFLPRTLGLGLNPYSTPVTITYNQYGTIFQLGPVTYIYLPVLLFFQPFVEGGTGYKVFCIVTWAAAVYLVRKDAFAVVAIGQPYMGLLAASGFNDFPVLFLLTLAFVGVAGKRQKWAEYLALGAKQFANVLVVIYYAIKRDWRNLGIALAVSLAWVLPFLVWDPGAFLCNAVTFSPSGCSGTNAGTVLFHLNYWAWPVWSLAIFFVPLRAYYRRYLGRDRKRPSPAAPPPPRGANPPRASPTDTEPPSLSSPS